MLGALLHNMGSWVTPPVVAATVQEEIGRYPISTQPEKMVISLRILASGNIYRQLTIRLDAQLEIHRIISETINAASETRRVLVESVRAKSFTVSRDFKRLLLGLREMLENE